MGEICYLCILLKTKIFYSKFQFEFLGAAIGTCVYMASFVLCIEWLSSKHRVLGGAIISAVYSIGEIFLGVAAILYPNYRTFLIVVYAPALLIVFYFWLIPESVRWLVVAGKYNRAIKILRHTAKKNRRQLSGKSSEILTRSCSKIDESENDDCLSECSSVLSVLKHKVLVCRLITCSMCWVMIVFIFFGLSLNATRISGDDNKVCLSIKRACCREKTNEIWFLHTVFDVYYNNDSRDASSTTNIFSIEIHWTKTCDVLHNGFIWCNDDSINICNHTIYDSRGVFRWNDCHIICFWYTVCVFSRNLANRNAQYFDEYVFHGRSFRINGCSLSHTSGEYSNRNSIKKI